MRYERKRKGTEKAILLQDRIRERVGKYDLAGDNYS
jgi:hypothetical protein